MASYSSLGLVGLLGLATLTSAVLVKPSCPIVLDGRVAGSVKLSDFDTAASPFQTGGVLGQNLKFSQVLQLPPVPLSRFDLPSGQAVQVSINDKSVFKPGTNPPQTGFRRIGLILAKNDGKDASTTGVKTFHWSVRALAAKPLNTSHEYLNAWHETSDYSANQWNFQTGSFIGKEDAATKDYWKLTTRKGELIFQTKIVPDQWQNFAIKVDTDKNTLQAYYSYLDKPLVAAGKQVSNDNSGAGQFQIGILKKPTGGQGDITKNGFQPSGIDERLTYGGIFVEDSSAGCVSL